MDTLNGRNTETVEKALKDVYAKLYEALGVIKLQQTALSSLAGRMGAVEAQLNLQKARTTGLGPTVR
jgi:hypothetical protein